MDINQNNPKKFLQIQITNFEKKLFTILYLDEFTRTIHHTEPSDNTLLSNLNNFPIEWAFSQENKPLTDDINPKILPNPTTNIEVIHINFNFKKYSNSNNSNNTIQITSRLLSSRNAHKVFTVTNNYIKKFPPIPSELQNQLNSYILSLQQKKQQYQNLQRHQQQHQNVTLQEPITKQPIQSHHPNQSANPIHPHYTTTNTPQPINPTNTINKTSSQSLHHQLTLSNKQSIPTNQLNNNPLTLSDLSSNNNLSTLPLSNPPIPQLSHQTHHHSFQNISQINTPQTSPPTPIDISINQQPNSFDNIDNNLSISTLTSINSSQLSSMQIDQSHSTHPNSTTPKSQPLTIDSFDKFQQELNNEILNQQPDQTRQTPLPTSSFTTDIRTQSVEQDNKITQDLAQKLLTNLDNPQITLEIIDHIKNHNLKSTSFNYPSIFNKLTFKDKTFFKSFTHNENKPLHQIEYQKLETDYIENYKKDFKLTHVNYQTKQKIRSIICSLLSIIFLRNLKYNNYNPFQLSQLLQYLINYFIRKENTTFKFFDFYNLLKNNQPNLPRLPDSYTNIPSSTLIKLPHPIPIQKPSHIRPNVVALHNLYNFDQLPQSYIQLLPPLPQRIEDFPSSFQNIFPITESKNLKNLRDYKTWLLTKYNFYGPLPKCYFNLPPPKKSLPSTYQLLPNNLKIYFPYNSQTSSISFRELITKLKETFSFSRLPNDYFFIKQKLPPPSKILDPDFNFILPITSPNDIPSLLSFLGKKYTFTTPLSKEWINLPPRNTAINTTLPPLPQDYTKVNEIAGSLFPITRPIDLSSNIRLAHQHFSFQKIPDNWIQIITKPSIPSIDESNTLLKSHNTNLQLPLLMDSNFKHNIKILHQFFNFTKLPSNFITYEIQPEPTFSLPLQPINP